jgi:hypothetical protein
VVKRYYIPTDLAVGGIAILLCLSALSILAVLDYQSLLKAFTGRY